MLHKKPNIILGLFFCLIVGSYAQMSKGLFQFEYINGSLAGEGRYSFMNTTLKNKFSDKQKTHSFLGELELKTGSYFLHPNFLSINTNIVLRPGVSRSNFITIPNRTENSISENIGMRVYLFKERPYRLGFYGNFNHSYINRDNARNAETKNYNYTVAGTFNSKILPVEVKYSYEDMNQNELESERVFDYKKNAYGLKINKVLFNKIKNNFTLNYTDYTQNYSSENTRISNKILNAHYNLNAELPFTFKNEFNSLITYNSQVGTNDLKRLTIFENFRTKLPLSLEARTSYQHNWQNTSKYNTKLNAVDFELLHKLFSSLTTRAKVRFVTFDQNTTNELIRDLQFGVGYVKKIPTGLLNAGYTITHRDFQRESPVNNLSVTDEEITLEDGSVVLLSNPDVVLESILVTDIQNLVVYKEGVDYLIIEHGNSIEIKRLIGGMIENGSTVFVDYISSINPSYDYESVSTNFRTGITLINGLIDLGYSFSKLHYPQIDGIEEDKLNKLSRYNYSIKLNYGNIFSGYEYEIYNSNIIPYHSQSIYAGYNITGIRSFLASLTADYRTYEYQLNNLKQKFVNLVGQISYRLSMQYKVLLKLNYQYQEGEGIDLNFGTSSIEFIGVFNSIEFNVGLQYYDRVFTTFKTNYLNTFVKIKRNF